MNRSLVIRVIESFARSSNGPIQYSLEWYGIRKEKPYGKPRIGGSEIATLLGMNPFETREALLSFKETGDKEFKGNLACKFGTLFEDVAVRIFEMVNDVTIPCHGICLVDRGCLGLIFSPDGIGYMPVDEDRNIILPGEPGARDLFLPVLIEIKCPFRRIPSEDMPSYYVPQVQAGLIAVDIAACGLFLDNLIRVCTFGDLFTDEYNKRIHRDRVTITRSKDGYLGIICAVLTGKPSRGAPLTYGGVYDLGDVGEKGFETNLDVMDKRTIRIFDPAIHPLCFMQEVDEWIDINSGNGKMLGMICWKHFETNYTVIPRDKVMREDIYRAINDYLEISDDEEDPSPEEPPPVEYAQIPRQTSLTFGGYDPN